MNTKHRRKARTADVTMTCVGCDGPIKPGGQYVRDLTRQPWHRACRRLGSKVNVVPPPRHVGWVSSLCGGCDQPIGGEPATSLNAQPWHKECWMRR